MKREQAYFYQVYKGLVMGFGMCEAVFMAYMADLDRLRRSGADTLSGLNAHLGATGMGRRSFERCARKAVRMGLLERLRVEQHGIRQTGGDRLNQHKLRGLAGVLRQGVRGRRQGGVVRYRP